MLPGYEVPFFLFFFSFFEEEARRPMRSLSANKMLDKIRRHADFITQNDAGGILV